MDLDPTKRAQLAADLLHHLAATIPNSEAMLRGSLAAGRADRYSDVDLLWEIPDRDFAHALSQLPAILARVAPIASLRFDPDFQQSLRRRLIFIRFAGVPLFWRIDLDLFARSASRDDALDRDNPLARGSDWSYPESSLANSVAAIKAHLRGQDDLAASLLQRAEQRIGLTISTTALRPRILRLTEQVVAIEPAQQPFATQIRNLAEKALPKENDPSQPRSGGFSLG
jgi:predicted nucleotidyltransferase